MPLPTAHNNPPS
ncbi:unnamed protein product, partial [Alternaria burnsii]